jgi:hypothetical protein
MKQWKKVLALAGVAALCLSADSLMAQGNGGGGGGGGGGGRRGGGNFDPAQMRQRMMDRYKEVLEVTDDAEWKVLEPAIGKIMDAQQELRANNAFGRGGRGGGAGGGGSTNNTDNANGGQNNNRRQRGGFGGPPSPEVEALQAAIEAKAPADELKDKLAKVREAAKDKEAKLVAAQVDLQKLLSARQEAQAVLLGLLK